MEFRYHDYLALVTFLDQSPSIRLSTPFRSSAAPESTSPGRETGSLPSEALREAVQLTTACLDYRARLEKRCQVYSPDETDKVAEFLYRPACFVAFGHADSFGIVAVDSFDPVVSITMGLESPVERHSIGLLPDISSLGLPPVCSEVFVTLEALLRGSELAEQRIGCPLYHQFQDDLPLAQLALLKIGGLGTLGSGLRMRRAVFRAVALRITSIRDAIMNGQFSLANAQHPLIRFEDAIHLQCLLFEPQDGADVGVFIGCRNYSIAAALITALRNLTIADLIAADPGLATVLAQSEGHVALATFCDATIAERASPGHFFAHNHLFSASYSTLGVSPAAIASPEAEKFGIGGYLSVAVRFDVSPGHLGDVEEAAKRAITRILQKYEFDTTASFVALGERGKRDPESGQIQIHEVTVGRHDFTYVPAGLNSVIAEDLYIQKPQRIRRLKNRNVINGFYTPSFLYSMKVLLDELGVPMGCQEEASPDAAASELERQLLTEETGLIDVNSAIVILIPSIKFDRAFGVDAGILRGLRCPTIDFVVPQRISDQHRSLMAGLRRLSNAFLTNLDVSNTWNSPLQVAMRRLGLPKSLRRSISYLFQDFFKALGDPFQFDAVVDLLDSFSALATALGQLAGNEHSDFTRMSHFQRLTFADHQVIEGYSHLANSLMHALMHRISNPGPHTESWDLAVDVRGGLNKFVVAAEAPWKCGLAFLRHHLPPLALAVDPENRVIAKYARVGGLIHLSLAPRVVCREFCLRPCYSHHGNAFPRIAAVELDVSNLFSPMQFIHLFHEAAHLLGSMRVPGMVSVVEAERHALTKFVSSDLATEELYAGLLTHLIVFGGDSRLYIRHQLASFAVLPEGKGIEMAGVLYSVSTFLSLLFMVTDSIGQIVNQNDSLDPLEWSRVGHAYEVFEEERVQLASDAFLNSAKQLCPQLIALVDSFEGVDEYCRLFMGEMWDKFRSVLTDLTVIALADFKSFMSRDCCDNSSLSNVVADRARLKKAMQTGMNSRNVLIGVDRDETGGFDSGQAFCDFDIITEALRHCVESTLGTIEPGQRAVVDRKSGPQDDGGLDYQLGVKYSEFQIDITSAELVCSVPGRRRDRLSREIMALRLMWDASTRQRSRRIGAIAAAIKQ